MNSVLVWILVSLSPPPHYTPQTSYQFANQADCLRARGKMAHYDDRLKRQWTCEAIRIAMPAQGVVDPMAVDHAHRNNTYEQRKLDRIINNAGHR